MDRKQTRAKVKPLIKGIDNEELISMLEQLASELGVEVRQEKGDFHSAGCRVEDQRLIILKKTDSTAQKATTLLRELALYETGAFALPTPVRERLELYRGQAVEENGAA